METEQKEDSKEAIDGLRSPEPKETFVRDVNPPELSPEPKLYVDVNIGGERVVRIVVYEGDTPNALAVEFCEKHLLGDDMKKKMELLLEKEMKGLLAKLTTNRKKNEVGENAADQITES